MTRRREVGKRLEVSICGFEGIYLHSGPMAQLVRAPPCHGGGRGFESHSGRCNIILVLVWGLSSAGRASALQAEGHRFEPCRPHSFIILRHYFGGELADVAQLAEQLICNQQVIGSSPIIGF